MTTRNRALPLAALLAACLLVSCGASKEAPKPSERAPRAVRTVAAALHTIAVETEFAAQIRAGEDFIIASKVPGRIATVNAKVGQRVAKGQVLLTLESPEYEAQYRQALAAAKAANANVDRTSGSAQSLQVNQAEAAVSQSQVAYQDAQRLYDRTQKLFDSGVATGQQLDGAKARLEGTKSQLDSAQENLKLINAQAGRQATDVVSAQAEQAAAAADLAKTQLDSTSVTSAISGVVTARYADPGGLVSAGMPILTIMDANAVTADVSVPESIIGSLKTGDTLSVTVPSVSAESFTGMIDSVAPASDPRTLGFPVKIRIENAAGRLRPGLFARVRLVVARSENALSVPNNAVIMENAVDYLWIVSPDSVVSKRAVTVGLADASYTEVLVGLTVGELVVPEGQAFLNEGDRVNPVR
jgi:HlyD family secretion protein